jgi:hypothetical protein
MNNKFWKNRYTFLVLSFIIMCLYVIYAINFKKELKSKSIVTEITNMKINQVSIDSVNKNLIYFHYLVGDKYSILVSRKSAVPYSSPGYDEVFITDINGKIVVSYYTEFESLCNAWESDYKKLITYLKL